MEETPRVSASLRKHGASFVSLDIDHGQEPDQSGTELSSDALTENNDNPYNKARFYVLLVVENIAVQILSILLILTDVTLAIAAIASSDALFDKRSKLAGNCIMAYFVVEISLRFFGIGAKRFTRNVWEMADAAVIFISLAISLALNKEDGEYGRLSIGIRIFRLVRVVRLIPQCRKCILSLRLTTSENKRRYREDGYDLDLTYITERVIAMSFPSSGWLMLYRNPIEEVSKFFKSKHRGHFRIYNLCSERNYDYQPFDYSVKRYMIDDHNVPTLEQILHFVKDAQRFLKGDESNVVAVHCKGGKGRTGTMICAFLMYTNKTAYPTGEKARAYFATRRSDTRVSQKFQGVQTPSQCRFIDYFQEIIHTYDCVVPEPASLFIKTLIVRSPPSAIQDPRCSLLVEVWDRKRALCSFSLLSSSSFCTAVYKDGDLVIEFLDHVKPCVTGDIKVRFRSGDLPIKYDKASFYFWFNTSFVQGSQLHIEREMLDNPHFAKYNKIYDENFAVTVKFDRNQQQRLV